MTLTCFSVRHCRVFSAFVKEQGKKMLMLVIFNFWDSFEVVLSLRLIHRNVWIVASYFSHAFTYAYAERQQNYVVLTSFKMWSFFCVEPSFLYFIHFVPTHICVWELGLLYILKLALLFQVLREALESSRDKLEQHVEEIVKVKNIKPQKDPL